MNLPCQKTQEEITELIEGIKKNRSGNTFHNYFFGKFNNTVFDVWLSDDSIVFLDNDDGFFRLYFFTRNLADLSEIIKNIDRKPITIDYLSHELCVDVDQVLKSIFFKHIATCLSMTSNKPKPYKINKNLEFAGQDDLEILFERLHSDFDKYSDHLPMREVLKKQIDDKQVLVVRREGKITGYFVHDFVGIRCHWMYWYSSAENTLLDGINLLMNMYGLMNEKGIKLAYGWVNSEKKDNITLYEKLGFNLTRGIRDYIYLKD